MPLENQNHRAIFFESTIAPVPTNSTDWQVVKMIATSLRPKSVLPTASPEDFFRPLSRRRFRQREHSKTQRGVAVIEVALCLPVLLLVTLLFIEFTNLIFLRQSLKVSSYEGIRAAIKQSAEFSDVQTVCAEVLDSRKVFDYEVSVEPENFSNLPRGTLVTVTIVVQTAKNQLFGLLFEPGDSIVIQSFGLKE